MAKIRGVPMAQGFKKGGRGGLVYAVPKSKAKKLSGPGKSKARRAAAGGGGG